MGANAPRETLPRRIVRKGCSRPDSNAGPRDRSKLPYRTWHPWAAGKQQHIMRACRTACDFRRLYLLVLSILLADAGDGSAASSAASAGAINDPLAPSTPTLSSCTLFVMYLVHFGV